MTCGIYEIWISDYYYQGSSVDVDRRIKEHKNKLKKGTHDNSYLQNVWNKHQTFEHQIILECEPDVVLAYEQDYLDANWGLPKFMNLNPYADRPNQPSFWKGKVLSEDHRAKISAALVGIPKGAMSDETKAKVSASKRAQKLKAHNRKMILCNGKVYQSQTELAKHLGKSVTTISRWLTGRRSAPKNIKVSYHKENK